ncbi:ATP synthase F1 subunit gamma [Sorangium sp. So ce1153]|uniref:ATP synthase F1 subunit gamma n=1 Tax=Sorangium sp. So ce1153 TaxID=3133333 RepID=UPI003F60526B
MPSLKSIRKRISSVKSTQKITRAMKMVAGAKLNKAQQRITELRPYAVKVQEVLWEITRDAVAAPSAEAPAAEAPAAEENGAEGYAAALTGGERPAHPLLVTRPERRVLLLVLTSDRGLCGAFNTNINKRAEREWKSRTEAGQEVQIAVIGRKGRDYLNRRNAPILEYLPGVWDKLSLETAQAVGAKILAPFNKNEVDAIYIVYNEFKSAITQTVVVERLLPAGAPPQAQGDEGDRVSQSGRAAEFVYEPDRGALLERLVPMYVDISMLRALYESMASELGAKLTAMDAANKNAKEMIDSLTLEYNKARQAAITKELMEIIGGSEALKE